MTNILIADDDATLVRFISERLVDDGFAVSNCNTGRCVLHALADGTMDMILIDPNMPGLNGLETLRTVRAHHDIPIIVLTADENENDRVVGLDLGADDYITKPFPPRELTARIRAVLRRYGHSRRNFAAREFNAGPIQVFPASRLALINDQAVHLTTTEFNLLVSLVANAGTVVSKAQLTEDALDRKLAKFDRSIDVHVSNLRKKLTEAGDIIRTIHGVGYQMVIATPPLAASNSVLLRLGLG